MGCPDLTTQGVLTIRGVPITRGVLITLREHTITFELSEVVALLSSDSLSDSVTGTDMPDNTAKALSSAFWKDSEIVVGWIPGGEGPS